MKKIMLLLKSICIYIKYKILYGDRISINLINSIRGKCYIEIQKNGKVSFGKFLMTRGPLYVKCLENAKITCGDKTFFNHNCSITCAERIEIGSSCMIANNLVMIDHDHIIGTKGVTAELTAKPIIIEDNVWIGANVTILKGVHIGRGAVIAAGAVVTQDIPPYHTAMGIPARVKM